MLSQSLFRIKEFRTHLTMRRHSFLDRFLFTNLFLYMFNIRLSFTKDILALFTSKFPPFFTFTGRPVFLPKAGRGGPFENLITFGTLDILKKTTFVMMGHDAARLCNAQCRAVPCRAITHSKQNNNCKEGGGIDLKIFARNLEARQRWGQS